MTRADELRNNRGAEPAGRPSDENTHAQPPDRSITLASADTETIESWISVQTVI
jgi:hypothetical protein